MRMISLVWNKVDDFWRSVSINAVTFLVMMNQFFAGHRLPQTKDLNLVG